MPYQLDPALQALRQPGERILCITLKSLLTQFQKEFWSRFSIPLVRLDSVGLQRVRNNIPSNLKYRNYLENAWWDIIIIDECHNVAARGHEDGLSRRARLARLLSGRSDTMILLSATPHDGSARSFASLMSLLDPTAISDPDDYTTDPRPGRTPPAPGIRPPPRRLHRHLRPRQPGRRLQDRLGVF